MTSKQINVVGLMSGSSLDGLDLAACTLTCVNNWSFSIQAAITIPFPATLKERLRQSSGMSSRDQTADLSDELALFMAEQVHSFLSKNSLPRPDILSSHGHTLSHHPERGDTLQIGNGQVLADRTGIPVVWDFRMADILAGGQGAPLVPVCDELLFPEYGICLNLGGIANLSMRSEGQRTGYDICAANQLLNALSQEAGLEYDDGGRMASTGQVIPSLLKELDDDPFLKLSPPRSLDNTYVTEHWIRVMHADKHALTDRLRTATEHVAGQIVGALDQYPDKTQVLVTGGGARNSFLLERIRAMSRHHVSLPDDHIILFKEALAMALMGALRWWEMPNFLPSVTGASQAVSGGVIAYPSGS